MANIKLGDLCKEIDASYKEMMTYLRERGCDVKSAGSIINDEDPEVKIAITLYGKKKRRAAAEKTDEKRPARRFDDKGNRVVKKDGVIYSVDKGGNYTKYTGPLYDENHNKLEMKKSLFDADKNPIVRKGGEFYRKDANGELVLYDGPIFNEEGRRMKRPTKEGAAETKTEEKPAKTVEAPAPEAPKEVHDEAPEEKPKAEPKKATPKKSAAKKEEPKADAAPDPLSGIPKALADLMRANNVTRDEIEAAVSIRGYFPHGTPIENYPKEFVDGCLVGAWPQVFSIVEEVRNPKDVPF